MSWRARNGFAPRRAATNASSCARGSPSRFTRSLDTRDSPYLAAATLTRTRADLNFAKEVADLARRGIGRVGTVNDVLVGTRGKIRPNGSLVRLLWIRGAHHLTIFRNCVFAFQHLYHHGTRAHEANQVLEERPLAIGRVETLRLG